MKNNKHYCYSCEEFFEDSNPNITKHKGCKHPERDWGVCVNSKQFKYPIKNKVGHIINTTIENLHLKTEP